MLPTVPISVFIADDHELVRRGLIDLLKAERGIVIVGEASTVGEAIARIAAMPAAPAVALLDGRFPDGSGVDICRAVRSSRPTINCLMLTSFSDDEALFTAIMAGASGYLTKEVAGERLVDAIREIAAGRSLIDPTLTSRLLERLRTPPAKDLHSSLNQREQEILELITGGYTNRQIGEKLYLAEKTVKNYVSQLLRKLGMQRRTQVAVYGASIRR